MKPILSSVQHYEREGSDFKGYYNEPFGGLTRFREMQNMTGQDAPLIRTRDPRRLVRTVEDCHGIFGRGKKLGWVSGTHLYYNGSEVGGTTTTSTVNGETVTTVTGALADNEKTFCQMGAWVLIMPDKKLFNTETGTLTNIENSVTIAGTVTYTPCDINGDSDDYATAVYVKVAATGIGSGFAAGDVVTFTGSTKGFNGDYQLNVVSADYVTIIGTMDAASATQSGGLKLERTMPAMDYMTECDNRIWGCSSANHEVYACKLGDPTNWRCYQGLSTDSYAVTVGSEGDFTGAVTHLGYVLFFKEEQILKVYGNRPSNFQLTSSKVRGVEKGSEKSLNVMNETLYYLSQTGECGYEGALPGSVSQAWGSDKYHDGIAGSAYGRMWLSVLNGSNQPVLFTYEGSTGLWHIEDGLRVKSFAKTETALYAADSDGKIWILTGKDTNAYDGTNAADETGIPFMIETGDLEMSFMERVRVQKILARLKLGNGAKARIIAIYDDRDEVTAAAWTGTLSKMAREVAIIPHRCDHMRIRIEGTGPMELMNLNYLFKPGTFIRVK